MYDDSKRVEEGYVVSVARFAQSKNMSFRNLVFRRGICPTDIDLSFDFNNNVYFEGEGKLKGKEIDIGQKRHLQGKSRRIFMGGAESFVILFEHNATDTNEMVYIDECLVTEVFSGRDNKWKTPKKPITVFKCIKQIEKHCEVILKIKL
jgi:hypothetical protein